MARRSTARIARNQSTLTQLDFVPTPYSSVDAVDTIDSDLSDLSDRSTHAHKRKRRSIRTSRRLKRRLDDNTLTQIGFLQPITSSTYESEIVVNSQPEAEDNPASKQQRLLDTPVKLREWSDERKRRHINTRLDDGKQSAIQSSHPEASGRFKIPATPHRRRILEARSSQTPPSAALSATLISEANGGGSQSPLQDRGVRFQLSPRSADSDLLCRTTTVEDSQQDESPLTRRLTHEDFDEYKDERACSANYDTQPISEQFTFDPAASALDRDAERCRWTQLRERSTSESVYEHVRDLTTDKTQGKPAQSVAARHRTATTSPTLRGASPSAGVRKLDSSGASSPSYRPSQVSTVLPTQSSPRRPPPSSIEEITPLLVKTEAETLRYDDVLASSPLPAPPWSESGQAEWLRSARVRETGVVPDVSSMEDFSLPPPPVMNWSSISSAVAANDS